MNFVVYWNVDTRDTFILCLCCTPNYSTPNFYFVQCEKSGRKAKVGDAYNFIFHPSFSLAEFALSRVYKSTDRP